MSCKALQSEELNTQSSVGLGLAGSQQTAGILPRAEGPRPDLYSSETQLSPLVVVFETFKEGFAELSEKLGNFAGLSSKTES